VLLAVLGISAISFLSQIMVHEEQIRRDYVQRDRLLETLRSDIYNSGTYVRDFLLDSNDAFATVHRDQFLETERKLREELSQYRVLNATAGVSAVEQLAREVTGYLDALQPVLAWTVNERQARAYAFMQDELLPRRMSALTVADHIQQISESQLEQNAASVSVLLSSFRSRLLALLMVTIFCGVALATMALWRLLKLEIESRRRFAEVLSTRHELKKLSTELVSAQENERRRISRELHDEVGQVLSAIMLGLESLRSALRDNNQPEALGQLQLVQEMTERNARVVRNISLLLRPTMLDDLGLVPALKWLAREVSRTNPLEVEVFADAFEDDVPDEHRTCVFRVVQEALRNAARHSGARRALVNVREAHGFLQFSVVDDGNGFAPGLEKGLGILGMQERIEHLAGTMDIKSDPATGTSITFDLPLPVRADARVKASEGTFERSSADLPGQEISPLRTA